jgi:hypothetical protein
MVEHDYIQESPTARLRNWVLSEMLRGAGYAAVPSGDRHLLRHLSGASGKCCPEDSKNAPPPMPYSALEAPLDWATV